MLTAKCGAVETFSLSQSGMVVVPHNLSTMSSAGRLGTCSCDMQPPSVLMHDAYVEEMRQFYRTFVWGYLGCAVEESDVALKMTRER